MCLGVQAREYVGDGIVVFQYTGVLAACGPVRTPVTVPAARRPCPLGSAGFFWAVTARSCAGQRPPHPAAGTFSGRLIWRGDLPPVSSLADAGHDRPSEFQGEDVSSAAFAARRRLFSEVSGCRSSHKWANEAGGRARGGPHRRILPRR